jgi:hypothetical protein
MRIFASDLGLPVSRQLHVDDLCHVEVSSAAFRDDHLALHCVAARTLSPIRSPRYFAAVFKPPSSVMRIISRFVCKMARIAFKTERRATSRSSAASRLELWTIGAASTSHGQGSIPREGFAGHLLGFAACIVSG